MPASSDDRVASKRRRRTPRAVLGLALAMLGAALWCCALGCSVAGVDGHFAATCSMGAALGGAAFGILALEAIALDPERWRGRGLARAATGLSAAAIGLNVAAFAGPFAG